MTAEANAICAICYEDARPIADDLLSISLCGHVFHDICLQQWIEYTPRGRKATCPLCKKECTSKETHRLYFQSAADTAKIRNQLGVASKSAPCAERSVADEALVIKLEGQLSVAKAALSSYQEQLTDLDSQLSEYIVRVDKAEAARAEASRERSYCKEALARTQEELRRSMMERSMLLEKNIAMAKELAAHKLIGDTDIAEEDVLRLASLGRSSNKEDIIDTLTKSLVLRNRTYKDLMARCNELGLSEGQAVRKCEKSFEQMKKLKARVQELERKLEVQENAKLRSILRRDGPREGATGQVARQTEPPTSAALCRERLTKITRLSASLACGSLEDETGCSRQQMGELIGMPTDESSDSRAETPRTFVGDDGMLRNASSMHATSTMTSAMATLGVHGETGRLSDYLAMGQSSTLGTSPVLRTRSFPASKCGTDVLVPSRSKTFAVKAVVDVGFSDTERCTTEACNSSPKFGGHLSHPVFTCDPSRPSNNNDDTTCSKTLMHQEPDTLEAGVSLPIRRELSLAQGSSPRAQSSSPRFLSSSPRTPFASDAVDEGHGGGASSFINMSTVYHDDNRPSIPLDSKKIRTAGITSVLQGVSSGKYISSGADGRGGRVTILKPSQTSLGQGITSPVSTPSKPTRPKRSKLTDSHGNNRQGYLQLEHFFGRVAS